MSPRAKTDWSYFQELLTTFLNFQFHPSKNQQMSGSENQAE